MSDQVHSPRTAHVRSNHLMRPTQLIPIIQPHASEGQDQIMVGSCLGHTGVKRCIIEHQLTVGWSARDQIITPIHWRVHESVDSNPVIAATPVVLQDLSHRSARHQYISSTSTSIQNKYLSRYKIWLTVVHCTSTWTPVRMFTSSALPGSCRTFCCCYF